MSNNELIIQYLPLMRSIAQRYVNRSEKKCYILERDDYVHGSIFYVLKALEKYDPSKGVPEGAYVTQWIKSACSNLYRKYSSVQSIDNLTEEGFQVESSFFAKPSISEEEKQYLYEMLHMLPLHQQELLVHLYGLKGVEKLKIQEYADKMSLSRDQINRQKRKALNNLRKLYDEKELNPGLKPPPLFVNVKNKDIEDKNTIEF